MAETTVSFDDGTAYERFMGRWSRAAGNIFLEWLAPPPNVRWLDIGCGPGSFTELILDNCSPGEIMAVDPAKSQIEQDRRLPVGQRADFRVADSLALPFADDEFDIVASALVINFIPDRAKALAEMRRVARPGAIVAGYVWDFANGLSPNSRIQRAVRSIGGNLPPISGTADSAPEGLRALFELAGIVDIATTSIEVEQTFEDFNDFWHAQTPAFAPPTKIIAALPEAERTKLRDSVRAGLPPSADGTITYMSRANAVRGRVPT
jgi:ubiquinone/menaquinone biosynthesis C-methylase UbiE